MAKLCFLCFLITYSLFGIKTKVNAQNRALICAATETDKELGFNRINCKKDTMLVKRMLLSCGFKNSDLIFLVGTKLTKQNFIFEIENLIKTVEIGTTVYIHFSGYGQQIPDDNNDEIDGADEALAFYDTPANDKYWNQYMIRRMNLNEDEFNVLMNDTNKYKYLKYKFQYHLRDDTLKSMLDTLRKRIGKSGQLIAAFDCSFSGTITRGEQINNRSGQPYVTVSKIDSSDYLSEYFMNKNRGIQDSLSNLFVFGASAPHKPCRECILNNKDSVGCLTKALYKSLLSMPRGTTFKGVYERVCNYIWAEHPYQQPTFEGVDSISMFSNMGMKIHQRFIISNISGDEITVKAGILDDISNGDKFEVFSSGITNVWSVQPVAIGTINQVFINKSIAVIKKNSTLYTDSTYYVYISKRANNYPKVKIHLSENLTKAAAKSVRKTFEKSKFVILTDKNPDFSFLPVKNDEFKIEVVRYDSLLKFRKVQKSSQGDFFYRTYYKDTFYTIGKQDINSDNAISLHNRILKYIRYEFIKNVQMIDEDYWVNLRACNFCTDEYKKVMFQEGICSPKKEFEAGDKYVLEISNLGTKPAYFMILDIQPNGIIQPIMPYKEITKEECYIKPNSTITLSLKYQVAPPYGKDILKIFSSDKPIDPSPFRVSQVFSRDDMDNNNIDFDYLFNSRSVGTDIQKFNTFEYPIYIYPSGTLINLNE